MNAKLPRFNLRFWNPGSEGIDAFVIGGLQPIPRDSNDKDPGGHGG